MTDFDLEAFARAVGRRLRQLRKRRNLSLEEVAAQAGLSVAHLSQVERGVKLLSFKALLSLAQTLQLRRRELLSVLAEGFEEGLYRDEDRPEGLQAVLVTVGRYPDSKGQLQRLSKQLQPLLAACGMSLSKPLAITSPRGSRLEKMARKAALIIDATGLFTSHLWGSRRKPFTHAGLVAASHNIPYLCMVRRSLSGGIEIIHLSGWTDVYRDGGYFSEEFEEEEAMLDYLQKVILPRTAHRWRRA